MAHKNKIKPTSAVASSTNSAGLADLAAVALDAARYKVAIEHFKELLKRERRSAWLEGLAVAYAGRAEQLAAKGMVKEALALWRTRADACAVPLLAGPYLGWLMKSGEIALALSLLPALDQLPAQAQDQARAQLAPAVLLAPDHLLTGLPEDSRRHRAAARAALAACVQGDEVALAVALQAISFRSPYRDLRSLLKAQALRTSDPSAAAAALARVPEKGPFEPLAQALRVSLMPGTEWLAGLRQLDDAGRSLVLDLKGCPPAQRALVLDLMARAAASTAAPLDLFDLVLRHRRALPDAAARQFCLGLLPHAPQRLDAMRSSSWPLTAAEQERVLALAAEVKQQPEQAEGHWLRLIRLLRNTAAGQPRAALVLRHLADQHTHHSPDGALCTHALDWLAQSLELDPTDRGTHLRLVRDARKCDDLKQARSWLDAARKLFPEDAPLLQEAVEVALAGGAFKKAAGLAKQVLQTDPLNPRVRALIGQAHLAHARKQLGAHNPQAARRELDEAATWLRSADDRGRLKLLCGLAAESAAAGDALLRDAVAELGGPPVGAFLLLLEGRRIKCQPALEPKALLRRTAVDPAAPLSAEQVAALAHALNTLPEGDQAAATAIQPWRHALEGAASALRLSESQDLLVCEALHRQRQPDLTRRFAAAALKRWPQRPVFVYLDVAARFGAQPWRITEPDFKRLDRAFEQAQDQGDQRTATRLRKLLGAADFEPPDSFDDTLAPELDDFSADDISQVVDAMLAAGGEDLFLEMARQQLGKATFDQLRREIKGSKKQFARALAELLAASKLAPPPPARTWMPPKAPPAVAGKKQPDLFDD